MSDRIGDIRKLVLEKSSADVFSVAWIVHGRRSQSGISKVRIAHEQFFVNRTVDAPVVDEHLQIFGYFHVLQLPIVLVVVIAVAAQSSQAIHVESVDVEQDVVSGVVHVDASPKRHANINVVVHLDFSDVDNVLLLVRQHHFTVEDFKLSAVHRQGVHGVVDVDDQFLVLYIVLNRVLYRDGKRVVQMTVASQNVLAVITEARDVLLVVEGDEVVTDNVTHS